MLAEEPHPQSPYSLATQPEEVIMYIATAHPIATMWKPAMLLFATCKLMFGYITKYFNYIGTPLEFADQLMRYARSTLSQYAMYNVPVVLPSATKFIDSVADKSSSNQLLEVIAMDQFKNRNDSFEDTKMTILTCISCDVTENNMSESEKLVVKNIIRGSLLLMIRDCLLKSICCDKYDVKYFAMYTRSTDILYNIDCSNEYDLSILAKYIIHSVNYLFRLCGVARELIVDGHIIEHMCRFCEQSICECAPDPGSFRSDEIAAGRNMCDWFNIEIAHKIT